MVWALWYLLDLPISFVAFPFAEDACSNAGGVVLIVLIGGLQWAFWGWLVERLIAYKLR